MCGLTPSIACQSGPDYIGLWFRVPFAFGGMYETAGSQGAVGAFVPEAGRPDEFAEHGSSGTWWLSVVTMSCYRPLAAYRDRAGGRPRIGVAAGGRLSPERGDKLELPCGKCVGCRLDRSRAWSIRAMHEASLYDASRFVTLTYDDAHLRSWSLEYRDIQLFLKRLRKHKRGVSAGPNGAFPIRYFVSGEYGAVNRRPHFHALLFNCAFDDETLLYNGTRRSSEAERLWSQGHVVIGDVTPRSAAYCAGYTLSKVSDRESYDDVVDVGTGEVLSRRVEFCQMSRNPGIGAWWYKRYGGDLFPHDFAVSHDGRKWKVPRYYMEKFRDVSGSMEVEAVVLAREDRARAVPVDESSDRRRADREACAQANVKIFQERKV